MLLPIATNARIWKTSSIDPVKDKWYLDQLIDRVEEIIDVLRADNPDVKIFVAKIIPGNQEDPAANEAGHNNVIVFNNRIPALAAEKSTSRSPVIVVDQWTGFDPSVHTIDGCHPTAAGEKVFSGKL